MAICCATPLRNAEIAGPKEYLEPKFYANGEGEPTIGVTYVGVIVEDGKYFKDSDNDKELDVFEGMTLVERAATMINAGSDVHGEWWGEPIQYSIFQQAYDEGKLTQEALDRATLKNLMPMFAAGEYENPYRDPEQSQKAMDDLSSKTAAMGNELSSKSLILLKNHENTLPLKETGKKVFVATFSKDGADDAKKSSWEATFTNAGYTIVTSAEEAEILMLDVSPALNENTNGYNTLEIGEDIEVIDTVPTVIDGVEYDICVSPNDVPGYDKDQYIDADILAKSPSGSYAYKDADGNVYKAWFGLSFE